MLDFKFVLGSRSFVSFVGENEFNDNDYQLSNLKLKNKYGFFISVHCLLLMHINEHKCINLNKIQFSIVWLYVGCRLSDWKCTMYSGKKREREKIKRKRKRPSWNGANCKPLIAFRPALYLLFCFSFHHRTVYSLYTVHILHKRYGITIHKFVLDILSLSIVSLFTPILFIIIYLVGSHTFEHQ